MGKNPSPDAPYFKTYKKKMKLFKEAEDLVHARVRAMKQKKSREQKTSTNKILKANCMKRIDVLKDKFGCSSVDYDVLVSKLDTAYNSNKPIEKIKKIRADVDSKIIAAKREEKRELIERIGTIKFKTNRKSEKVVKDLQAQVTKLPTRPTA